MQKIELTSKLMLAIIGLAAVSAILIPTYAVPTIRSADIFDETIQSVDIKNGEVKTQDLAGGAIQLSIHKVTKDGPTVHQGDDALVQVDCPAGEIVTGGGYLVTVNGINNNARVTSSNPIDADTWVIIVENDGAEDIAGTAIALCIDPSIP